MATLQLGTYDGDPRLCDKTTHIAWVDNETFVEVANGSNIEHFTIVLEDVEDTYNYAKINDAYYFVSPVDNGVGYVNTFNFDLDYYYTYKDIILNTECIIHRSASHTNAYLVDTDYILSSKTETITKEFPNAMDDDSIILMTVG